MGKIQIVEYNKKYAASVADMWNKSGENWGGENTVKTEEDIILSVEKAGNIKTFLAIDGEEVVGYCSFSDYKHDEGASYIPLLNVRPDCIGKKIGKQLVLACVNQAMIEKWPRLDLYTWPGNEKAVPLYKKCGFFWEKRDDSTHLMNFIPYVMKTEAVKEYFEKLDWYKDSIRQIEVISDGRTEGEFDYFDYHWEKDDLSLEMEFERKGRGLSGLETNDYSIKARVDKQNLVFGLEHIINYEIINKSGKPLKVEIQGLEHKNIKFDYHKKIEVNDKVSLRGEFFQKEIDEPQDKWKSHPTVLAQFKINGLSADFAIGINPKMPVEVQVRGDLKVKQLGRNRIYLDMENGFDEKIRVRGNLEDSEEVKIVTPDIELEIEARGKVSIPIDVELYQYGFYNKSLILTIKGQERVIDYNAKVQCAFRGIVGQFHGENKDDYLLFNGKTTLLYHKKDNVAAIKNTFGKPVDILAVQPPSLGKPFFNEFLNIKPISVTMKSEDNKECLVARFISEKRPGIEFDHCFELYQNGLVENYLLVYGDKEEIERIYVNQKIHQFLENGYLPIDHQVVHTQLGDGMFPLSWDFTRLSENWLFSSYDLMTKSVCWDSSHKVDSEHVFINIESKGSELIDDKGFKTKPVVLALDVFSTWQELRTYAGNKGGISETGDFNLSVNGNNPFIKGNKIPVEFKEFKKIKCSGNVEILASKHSFSKIQKELVFEEGMAKETVEITSEIDCELVETKVETLIRDFENKKLVFFKGDIPVKRSVEKEEGLEVYQVSNDRIRIKSAPEFGPGIFSMKVDGCEWLDNSFPRPDLKAWWNYWIGGIHINADGLSYESINEETKSVQFVELEDTLGNIWTGMKSIMKIEKNKEFKGITIEEYFLMMPGVALVCEFVVLNQESGKYMPEGYFGRSGYVKCSDDIRDNWVMSKDGSEWIKFHCGENEYDTNSLQIFAHGSSEHELVMTRFLENDRVHENVNTNNINLSYDLIKAELPHGKRKLLDKSFYIFTKEPLEASWLKDLDRIEFENY